MQTPLNRIESEYIFASFLREKPKLTILCNSTFLTLNNFQYRIKENHIFFKNEKIKKNDELKIYFSHKDRPLYFKTAVNEKQDILFFELGQHFFKDDAKESASLPYLHFKSAGGFNLIIHDFEDYSAYNSSFTYADKNALFAMAEHIEDTGTEKLPAHLISTMSKIINGKHLPVFKPGAVFIDSEYILIFCAAEKIKPLLQKESAKTDICFQNRRVVLLSACVLWYTVNTETLKEPHLLVLFAVKDIQEEDKRFLYEKAYGTKYGTLNSKAVNPA